MIVNRSSLSYIPYAGTYGEILIRLDMNLVERKSFLFHQELIITQQVRVTENRIEARRYAGGYFFFGATCFYNLTYMIDKIIHLF